jgi:hypothetical protein
MSLEEKKHFTGGCAGLIYMRSLHWGGGVLNFYSLALEILHLVLLSAIRRAPTHQDTIEQGALRTVLSAHELLRAENHWLIWSDSVRSVITLRISDSYI